MHACTHIYDTNNEIRKACKQPPTLLMAIFLSFLLIYFIYTCYDLSTHIVHTCMYRYTVSTTLLFITLSCESLFTRVVHTCMYRCTDAPLVLCNYLLYYILAKACLHMLYIHVCTDATKHEISRPL